MSTDNHQTFVSCEENDNVDLTIVLLCGGSGSLAHTYRPNNDESQWWGRRDALVRCVTTSLFSSTSPNIDTEAAAAPAAGLVPAASSSSSSTQLMLLYEEDMSLFHMTRRRQPDTHAISRSDKNDKHKHKQPHTSSWTIPTEQNIIRTWKQAAMRANNREPPTTMTESSSLSLSSATNTIGSFSNNHKTSVSTTQEKMSPLNVTCYQDAWQYAAIGEQDEDAKTVSSMIDNKGRHGTQSAGAVVGLLSSQRKNSLNTSGSSKREVLEQLRQSCSMEFLRQHRLNSPVDVVLRKTNRTKLVQIWKQWLAEQQQQQQQPSQEIIEPKQNQIDPEQEKTKQMELIFKGILSGKYQPKCGDKKATTPKGRDDDDVMAVYLHETCGSELPCFLRSASCQPVTEQSHHNNSAEGANSSHPAGRRQPPKRVCLFLGAVRDMHPWEYQALQNACHGSGDDDGRDGRGVVPLMGMRLGPVPEFTSKILSVVVQHNARSVLGPALHRLQIMTSRRHYHPPQDELQSFLANGMGHAPHHATHKRQKRSKHDSSQDEKAPKVPRRRRRRRVHVVYTVSLDSSQLSCELSNRTREMWCLVRVCVSCLWRSRLASSTTTTTTTTSSHHATTHDDNHTDDTCLEHDGLENYLSICFQDGLILTLEQEELVLSLASQHQAAPSEHQVLAALCRKRDEALLRTNTTKPKNMNQRDFTEAYQQTIASAAAAFPNTNVYALKVVDTEGMGEKKTRKRMELVRLVYGEKEHGKKKIVESCKDGGELLFVLLHMLPHEPLLGLDHEKIMKQHESMETRTFDMLGIPVTYQSILGSRRNIDDWEGSTVTMLQHFDYQGLLFPSIKQIKAIRKASRKSIDRVE